MGKKSSGVGGGGGGGGGGKGIRGEREKNWGKKTEGEKRKGKKKENHGDRENRTVVAHIDRETFAQEPNALPVAYWDSPASCNSGLLLCTLMRMLSVTYKTHTGGGGGGVKS